MNSLELDLSSQNHDKFANAVSKCKGYTPECIANSKCGRDGECFTNKPKPITFDGAEAEISRLNREIERLKVKQTLFESMIEHHIQRLNTSYGSLKTALNENRRWAIHFARQEFTKLQQDLKRGANDQHLNR